MLFSSSCRVLFLLMGLSLLGCQKNAQETDEASTQQTRPGGPPGGPQPVFIQPFKVCKQMPDIGKNDGSTKEVCAQTSIAGATHEGYVFSQVASCDIVRTQRPFAPKAKPIVTPPDDPRLSDPEFMKELQWLTSQARSTGCACCHDSSAVATKDYANWDISTPGIWTDQLSTRALGLLSNRLDATTLGAYPKEENFGFDRSKTGIPTNDVPRMQRFVEKEVQNRGLEEQDFVGLKPLGGPLLSMIRKAPEACKPGVGIDSSGRVLWTSGAARYIYVLGEKAETPIVPPNLDKPQGTLWRLDVLSSLGKSGTPLESGLIYGSEPAGTLQQIPAKPAKVSSLVAGQTYRLHVLPDVPLASTSCFFTYPIAP